MIFIENEHYDHKYIDNPGGFIPVSTDIETVFLLSDNRKNKALLNKNALLLLEKSDDRETDQRLLREMLKEAEETGFTRVTKNTTESEIYQEKCKVDAGVFRLASPAFAACNWLQIAKAKHASGRPFRTELDQAKELIKQIDSDNLHISDLFPLAMLSGLANKSNRVRKMPGIGILVTFVKKYPAIIGDIAMVIDENERKVLLSSLPSKKRKKISDLIDCSLSSVVPYEDTRQGGLVCKRLLSKLKRITGKNIRSGNLPSLKRQCVALVNFNEPVAIRSMIDAGRLLAERREFAFSARIIRTISDRDIDSGGQMIIELLADTSLDIRYFNYFISYLSGNGFLEKNIDKATALWDEDRCRKLYAFLKERHPLWQDKDHGQGKFGQYASVFGYKAMLSYAGRADIHPSDALLDFDSVIGLYILSGMTPGDFFSKILRQVKSDPLMYDGRSSYFKMTRIAGEVDLSAKKIKCLRGIVKAYGLGERYGEYLGSRTGATKIFSSWHDLKSFFCLTEIVKKQEYLQDISELKRKRTADTGKKNIYTFIDKLIFRTGSKADTESVLRFWKDPEGFFSVPRSYTCIGTEKAFYHAINPSNYKKIQLLDFSSADLRDAVVSGAIDGIMSLIPFEIIYRMADTSAKEYGRDRYRARINCKSDADALSRNNSTSSPFGSCKNSCSLTNLACAVFSMEKETDGNWQTIVRSDITINYNLQKSISGISLWNSRLASELPESFLDGRTKLYLSCEQLEIICGPVMEDAVREIFIDFFYSYLKYQNKQSSCFFLDETSLIIRNHNFNGNLGVVKSNTYLPATLVSYVENDRQFIEVLNFSAKNRTNLTCRESGTNEYTFVSSRGKRQLKNVVSPVANTDVLAMGIIERIAYPQTMWGGIPRIQNFLFASSINNKLKGRPDLSVKYTDIKGVMRGFAILFEGMLDNKPVIFIHNVAADPASRIAGGRLFQAIIEKYKNLYIIRKRNVPIYIEARNETSYAIIKKHLHNFRRKFNINFNIEETNEYQLGVSTIHCILITST